MPGSQSEVVNRARYQFWIDRGGTFTDVVARQPNGSLRAIKVLSENPEHYADATLEGIRLVLGVERAAPLPVDRIEVVKMGTTVATNALLERRGEPTLLLITQGFRDALRIAYQNRPRLFDRQIVLPELLYTRVAEVRERVGAHGELVQPLDEGSAEAELRAAFEAGFRAVAIVLMHAHRFPAHEQRLATLARAIGFTQVSTSHGTSALQKLVSRGDTTVVDAYLSPILRRYTERLAEALPGVRLLFMQSHGGLSDAGSFQGKDSILSGPAGGIVGMSKVSAASGFERVIGFDMGGTSTDVSHYAGEFEREFETSVAGVRLRSPMLRIHTVAAGGGSILHFDGSRFRVGPDSAGANPGPACYRRGGPLTVTDCNLMLGKLQADFFPAVFGPNADEPLDFARSEADFRTLAAEVERRLGVPQTPEGVAEGFLEVAVSNMANAILQVSLARGHDVSNYVLTTFGGAAGQHACRVADALGMRQVFAHELAGVLSAYGMGLAEQSVLREQALELPLTEANLPELHATLTRLEYEAGLALEQQGVPSSEQRRRWQVHLKYYGTDTALSVPFGDLSTLRAAFETAYRRRFSFLLEGKPIWVEHVAVEVAGGALDAPETSPKAARPEHSTPLPDRQVRLFSGGIWHDANVYQRAKLAPGDRVRGPCVIVEAHATVVVEPEWSAELTALRHLVLSRVAAAGTLGRDLSEHVDPVLLELFNNRYQAIAEQMGLRLQSTAHSVNIKERLDFSCAVFDAEGRLIANAPHMPVHLGSMGESVEMVIRENAGRIRPGDAYAVNDPYHGGTHLPDITVVSPVFDHAGEQLLFYVGSRGHHADVGGCTPGSMPPLSRHIDEEGVLLHDFPLVVAGRLRETELLAKLTEGPFPARNPQQNLADLRAQVAANQKGAEELLRLVEQFGLPRVTAYMRHVQDNAEEAVRRAISALSDGQFRYELDNGAVIAVAVRVDAAARSASIDFSGSSAQLPNNFNAPSAVCRAAVLYVFRTLVADDIPLNAGCSRPLNIVIPEGSLLAPRSPAAVVAGNVETASAITNALYGALGVLASSQSTMNNLTFGNADYQYYETISGGSGAGPGFDGTSVVQTHMTNSRLTDPEVLEWRFPVRVEGYAIRLGSGGAGRYRGGDGGVRRLRFLSPMTASILSNDRTHGPFGLAGGHAGAPGRTVLERADGSEVELPHIAEVQVEAGDVLRIETPGGGGYGTPE